MCAFKSATAHSVEEFGIRWWFQDPSQQITTHAMTDLIDSLVLLFGIAPN